VVDTSPFGHTLRLFDLPQQFLRLLRFLDLCAERDRVLAEHFGGVRPKTEAGFQEQWRAKIENLQRTFENSHVNLVTTAESFALNESVRSVEALRTSTPGLEIEAVILNRVGAVESVGGRRIRLRKHAVYCGENSRRPPCIWLRIPAPRFSGPNSLRSLPNTYLPANP